MKSLYLVPLAATLIVPAGFAQQSAQPTSQTQTTSSTEAQNSPTTDQSAQKANDQYATGAPLQGQAKEGFWGHLNPFARKKWVARQMDPIRGRVNELDELTAKNAGAIKDVDARAQRGIQEANAAASQADQHAQAANSLAQQANQTAQDASTRANTVHQAVSNLDQYQPVTDAEIRFRPGQTKLGDQAKQALDQIADQLKGHSGYILQVQGFSATRGQAGIANSQAITQSVVRYLVEQHDVPLYRIYTVGLGNAVVKSASAAQQQTEQTANAKPAATQRFRGGKVEVALLKNGIADLQTAQNGAQNGQSPVGATQGYTGGAQNAMPQNDRGAQPATNNQQQNQNQNPR
ncbi:MAG: OmpA family protein [Acidobacteriales bacterium]|nr:OmpA family protein [Terriglobales bacterium]